MNKQIQFFLIFLLAGFISQAQFSGIATYKSAATVKIRTNEEVSHGDQAAVKAQLAKAMQNDYSLAFNTYESSFKQMEKLDNSTTAQSGGVMVRVMGGGGVIYRNTKENSGKESADLFGKPFLIVDEPEKLNWTIGTEQKQIGKYSCQKATYMRASKTMEVTDDNEPVEVIDSIEVIAWFTPEIPVNHGPDEYWGLPGLIMEVNNGTFTFVCSKVVLNPEEGITIEVPDEGKEIDRESFRVLQEEKMQEMMEQYRGREGGNMTIRIGG
ncbi:MAG: GLPGLI family protein [Cyclobacteriaceae bacterium]